MNKKQKLSLTFWILFLLLIVFTLLVALVVIVQGTLYLKAEKEYSEWETKSLRDCETITPIWFSSCLDKAKPLYRDYIKQCTNLVEARTLICGEKINEQERIKQRIIYLEGKINE